MSIFYVEITAEDRLSIQSRIQNNQLNALRIKRQVYERSDRVVTDAKGFEPFNVGNWTTLVKYENWKGTAFKDALRPTPATFSPIGIHVKEEWGVLDPYALVDKTFEDLKAHWQTDYINYGTLPPLAPSRIEHFERNLSFVRELVQYIMHDRTIFEQIEEERSIMPLPKAGQDDWLIEENTNAMNRVEKLALRGRLSVEDLGNLQIITHRPRQKGEDIVSSDTLL